MIPMHLSLPRRMGNFSWRTTFPGFVRKKRVNDPGVGISLFPNGGESLSREWRG